MQVVAPVVKELVPAGATWPLPLPVWWQVLELHVRLDREEILLLARPVVVGVAIPVKPVAAYLRSNQHVGVRTIVRAEAH